MLVEELGEKWSDKLKEFDPVPLAAASIGQVHRGVLHDGTNIAIKIQVIMCGRLLRSQYIIGIFVVSWSGTEYRQ